MNNTDAAQEPEKMKIKGVTGFSLIVGFVPYIVQSVFATPQTFRLVTLITTVLAIIGICGGLIMKRGVHQLSLVGTFVFGGMLILSFVDDNLNTFFENWSGSISDAALVVAALIGMAVKHPFTLYYARQSTDPVQWEHNPAFRAGVIRVSQIITGVWAAYFAVSLACGILEQATHNSVVFNWVVPIVALVAAIKFTLWFPNYNRKKLLAEHPEILEQHRAIAEAAAAETAAEGTGAGVAPAD
ncbi:MAG: hypothetical protein IT198_05720 [Acidimicrobiia bacterium]|nr:hypothetical protein [Acidimicrobiia bacterium]